MKIFNKCDPWENKVNFVDDENKFIGYDAEQYCCEDPGWFISEYPLAEPPGKFFELGIKIVSGHENEGKIIDLPGWYIDDKYLTKVEGGNLMEGKMFIFKIYNANGEQKYLHIYNCQSGYYSHKLEYLGQSEYL